jgi:hypothetical protein
MAEVNETRVRLSAEGMAEVVSAFRTVRTEGQGAARDLKGAFAELRAEFESLGKYLVAGFGIVAVAEHLRTLFKNSLDTAEGLNRLSRQTGLTTNAIQAFQRAARETGVGSEEANNALAKFTASFGRAELGTGKANAALTAVGLNLKELQKLTPDQRLLAIAAALARTEEASKRSAVEMAIFSRGGTELDGALRKLGEQGFAPFLARLQELGLYLDREALDRLLHLKEQLRDVGEVQQGLANQLLAGLAPALVSFSTNLTRATAAGTGFAAVGEAIGRVLNFFALGFQALGTRIGGFFAQLGIVGETWGAAFSALMAGKVTEAVNIWTHGRDRIRQLNAEIAADVAAINAKSTVAELPASKPTEEAAKGGGQDTTAELAKVAKARADLLRAELDVELSLQKLANRAALEDARASYAAGKTSLAEYYAERARLINANIDAEIAVLRRKEEVERGRKVDLNDEAGQIEKRAHLLELEGKVAEANAQRRVELAANEREQEQQSQEVRARSITAQIKLLELEGKKVEAARLRLQLDEEALRKELQAANVPQADQDAALRAHAEAAAAEAQYKDAVERLRAELSLLNTEKKGIQDQVNSGRIFSLQGEQQILNLERQRLPVLEKEAAAAKELADRTKDPAARAAAAELAQRVQDIKTATDTAGAAMREFKDGVEHAIGQGLNTFLTEGIKNVHNLGKAFDDAAKQIFNDLIQLALKIEEEKFLQWIFGGGLPGFSGGGPAGAGLGGGGGGGGGSIGGGGPTLAAATGGYVRGPGTPTSDSIPAWLSDREYVVNADATGRPGVLPFLEAINRGGQPVATPRFAAGGSVVGSIGGQTFRGEVPRAAAPQVTLRVHPDALHLTLRDWFEREIADIAAKR